MAIDWSELGLDGDQAQKMQDAVDLEIAGLKKKNDQLLGRNKKLSEAISEHIAAAESNKLAAEEINSELAELRALKKRGFKNDDPSQGGDDPNDPQSQVSSAALERIKRENEKLAAEAKLYQTQVRDMTVDRQLDDAFALVNVPPIRRSALKAAMRQKAQYEQDEVTIEGEPLSDYIKQWASTDEGKAFVAAPDNSGAGSQGTGHRSNGKAVARTREDLTTPEEKAAFIQEFGSDKYLQVMQRTRG